uniref:Uncharacterized protein n=1 Tax=Amphimedon queenslandica TaxID=400682 RepID=A0A1X7SNI1_AMPQE
LLLVESWQRRHPVMHQKLINSNQEGKVLTVSGGPSCAKRKTRELLNGPRTIGTGQKKGERV